MKNKDQQAFPMDYRHEGYRMETGMTLRDYFASKVLQGIHSNHEILRCMVMDRNNCTRNKEEDTIHDYIAQECYQQADAMLKEREL